MNIKTILALGIPMVVLQAHALTISPGSELISRNDPNSTDEIITWINANTTYEIGTAAYKKDAEPEDEEGSFELSYSTEFNGDLSGGKISWDGGSYISDAQYLLVKDGNHEPAWYLFSLAAWDGQEEITLSGFWPDGGAISHVAVFGGRTSVPDGGATAALLGLGVAGLAVIRQKR